MTNQNQGALFESPQNEPNVAFGKFVKPEMYDIFGDYDLSTLTDAEKEWMTSEQLEPILFNPSKDADLIVRNISFNAYEFKLMGRNPRGLAATAMSGAISDNDLTEERLAAGARGAVHILEQKRNAMTLHLDKMVGSRGAIKELKKEARTPGYAHIPEARMKSLLNIAWQEFTTILDVVHLQRQWGDEQRSRAEGTLINYLTQGSQRDRVGHWQKMINLADNYLGARTSVFRNRLSHVSKELESRTSDA